MNNVHLLLFFFSSFFLKGPSSGGVKSRVSFPGNPVPRVGPQGSVRSPLLPRELIGPVAAERHPRRSSLGPWLQNTRHAEGPVPWHHTQLRCASSSRPVYQTLRSKRLNHVPPAQNEAAVPPSPCCCCSVAKSYPVPCDPRGLQHARLPCPSLAPGVSTNSCS